ncbi:hypothetical protein E8E12_009065 [Didymella heteroderae]|uniref:Uncharacterized protein n=1 Tax=Didymella heteroderae TaxID=1769908 RepID=A0A9P4WTD8_9PLEO|nr:hypothetical protein E8E12_009065 [Didymella heteroderae]
MSFSSTTPLLPITDTPTISGRIIFEIETKLNYVFSDESYLLHALGAQEPTFWTCARMWSSQTMLRSNNLDLSKEALSKAAKYLNLLHILTRKESKGLSDDAQSKAAKRILLAMYMDSKDQRMLHHAANYLGLYIVFPFETNRTVSGAGVESTHG